VLDVSRVDEVSGGDLLGEVPARQPANEVRRPLFVDVVVDEMELELGAEGICDLRDGGKLDVDSPLCGEDFADRDARQPGADSKLSFRHVEPSALLVELTNDWIH